MMQKLKHLIRVTHLPTREAYHLILLTRELQEQVSINQNAFNNTDNVSTLLQIVPVIIKNGNKLAKTNALLDSESDVTLITKDPASKLT